MNLFGKFLIAGALTFAALADLEAQTPEQQFEKADAELNRVYRELRGRFPDVRKEQLKQSQRQWIIQRDAAASGAGTPTQRLQILVAETEGRTAVLQADLKRSNDADDASAESGLLAEFRKADTSLNDVYKQRMMELDEGAQERLRLKQRAWISQRDSQAAAASSATNRLKALIAATAKRLRELQTLPEKITRSGEQVESANAEESLFPQGEVRPIYQEIAWDDPGVIADTSSGPLRAVTIKGSNRIFIFDRRSRLLFGSIGAGAGPLAENDPPGLLAFADEGRFIYSESQGHKTVAYQLSYVPALLPALVGACYKQQPIGPMRDAEGRIGVYEPADFDDEGRISETGTYAFRCVPDMLSGRGEEELASAVFANDFPSLAQRVGVFSKPNDSPSSNNGSFVLTSGLKASSDGRVAEAWDKLFESGNFADRRPYQILLMDIDGDSIRLMQDVKEKQSVVTIIPEELSLSQEGGISAEFYRNPSSEKDLRGYVSEPPSQVNGASLSCKIDIIDADSSRATLKDKSGFFSSIVPPVPDPACPPETLDLEGKRRSKFQMAFYYPGPQPLLVAYWMYPEKTFTDYVMGVFNPATKKWIYTQANNRSGRSTSETARHFYNGKRDGLWVAVQEAIERLDVETGKVLERVEVGSSFETFAISEDLIAGMPRMDERRVEIWTRKPLKMQAEVIWDTNGDIVVFGEKLHYATKAKSIKSIAASTEQGVYPFEQFDLRLNRPDIVLERLGAPSEAVAIAKQLREKRLKRMGVTEDMLKPDFHVPELEIVGEVPATADGDEINVAIKASDSKYPLERLKIFVNNVPVNGRDGESLRDQSAQSLERTIPIKLAAGRNKIQISVLNNAGAESLYANVEVNCTAKRSKPTLYAVAMGVSEYTNPEWNLKYAAKDARDVLERLKTRSRGSYGEVKELLLTDKQVTKDSLAQIKDFLKDATIDDTVLMFVAGHGLLDSKYDYYFGTTDIDFNNPAAKGIAFDEFDDLLAALPCLKKSLLIDTCHAGELDEEEKTLLASAGETAAPLPTGNGIAMRSIGTRGMNVKAIEGARGASEWYDRLQGLFVDLRRGSGSTILSSSAGAEYALESSEQQNGLFTYAVLEALDGKKDADTNKDGSVQMSELGEYVKKRVTELTNNKQTPNTRRVNLEGDFTLAKTK